MTDNRPYKFITNKTSMILSIIIVVLSMIFVLFLNLEINSMEEEVVPALLISDEDRDTNLYSFQDDQNKKIWLSSIKEVLVVLCSILGTNLIVSVIIEKKSQNDLYDEFLTEDLLQNSKFLKSIDKEKRKILLNSLEKIDYIGDNETYSELVNNVREKIISSDYKYYFLSNKTDIDCKITTKYIEKEIIKSVEIRSFEDSYTDENYIITKIASQKIENEPNIEIKKIVINGTTQNINNEIEYIDTTANDDAYNVYYDNINYTIRGHYRLRNKITFYNNRTTTIQFNYITRVPLTDKVYSSRLSVPCKNYHFRFKIDNFNTNYKINAQAFGFQDDAMKNPAGSRKNEVTYEINDWLFPYDGVFVTFYK